MASRLLAKKYLRSVLMLSDGSAPGLPETERECLEILIASHRTLRENEQRLRSEPRGRTRFGRLLWWLFARWL